MLVVRWADEATLDLVEIIDYIEERNPIASARLYDDIVQTVERLGDMPFCTVRDACQVPVKRL